MGRLGSRSPQKGRSGRRAVALLMALAFAAALGCASTPRGGSTHVVRPGENLYRISKHYGVSVGSIRRANRIRDVTELQVGQRLRIPGAEKNQPRSALSPATTRSSGSSARRAKPRSAPSGNRETALREADLRFSWPVQGSVSSGFGWRKGRPHEGIDIPARKGSKVRAAEAGRVIHAGKLGDYGLVVILKHKGRYSTVYAHNRKNLVRKGAFVERGDVIAQVGNSGNARGHHLHFEVRRNRVAQDPTRFLPRAIAGR